MDWGIEIGEHCNSIMSVLEILGYVFRWLIPFLRIFD